MNSVSALKKYIVNIIEAIKKVLELIESLFIASIVILHTCIKKSLFKLNRIRNE